MNYDIYFIYVINNIIEKLMNKFEFVRKINEQILNKLSSSVINSNLVRVRKKLNELNLNIEYSARNDLVGLNYSYKAYIYK